MSRYRNCWTFIHKYLSAIFSGRQRLSSSLSARQTPPIVTAPRGAYLVETSISIAVGYAALDASTQEPCSFEHWVEMQIAQRCWIEQELDVITYFRSHFAVTGESWLVMNTYWTKRLLTTPELQITYKNTAQKYKQMYGSAA